VRVLRVRLWMAIGRSVVCMVSSPVVFELAVCLFQRLGFLFASGRSVLGLDVLSLTLVEFSPDVPRFVG
jgi:hypothetical protein